MNKLNKILLIIDLHSSFGRNLLKGISRYSKFENNWSFCREKLDFYPEFHRELRFLSSFKNWLPNGIITREYSKCKEIVNSNLPIICEMLHEEPPGHIPRIHYNYLAIAKMATEYFINCGIRNFAYCGDERMVQSRYIQQAFRKYAKKFNILTEHYVPKVKDYSKKANETIIETQIAQWLSTLKKPIALLTNDDEWAQIIFESCKIAHIDIPNQLTLLSLNDDEFICETSTPTISSIETNIEQVGYEAAQLLDLLISGEPMKGQEIIIQPTRVIERQSTHAFPLEDGDIDSALSYINQNCSQNIQVSDVINNVFISRSTLDKKFKKTLGRTIHNQINHTRINRIKSLLIETTKSIAEIAIEMGCYDTNHISCYFRKATGYNPTEYRNKMRARNL